jgi:hypothetical protein
MRALMLWEAAEKDGLPEDQFVNHVRDITDYPYQILSNWLKNEDTRFAIREGYVNMKS